MTPVPPVPLPAPPGSPTAAAQPVANTHLTVAADYYRIAAVSELDPQKRGRLGQFMTPTPICRFMASLFSPMPRYLRVLDPGAGVGGLTAAFAERLCCDVRGSSSVEFVCYEIEPLLLGYLHQTAQETMRTCRRAGVATDASIMKEDFILSPPGRSDLFSAASDEGDDGFTHVIMNPPYGKISSTSCYRAALRRSGIETSNLYAGFMYLAAVSLRPGGEMVAIVPRSFCNGPYFKPFRESFFSMMSLRHVHVFESRNRAFKDDDVLQENIIVLSVKGGAASPVKITTSSDAAFDDMTARLVPSASVFRPEDPQRFLHIAANGIEQGIADRLFAFKSTLANLGIEVSTGPVVDFRLRNEFRPAFEPDTVPILYPVHFRGGALSWPKATRKPDAIRLSKKSRKWLWPNTGNFVVTRRFTTKEERRRIVASIYAGDLPGEMVGFENHLNVYHVKRTGLPRALAVGLAIYLNSTLVDRFFRQFNGLTQVNASDLRVLRYPSRDALERIGGENDGRTLSQHEIDEIIEGETTPMADDDNPIEAQRKIENALEVLKALGLPKAQQNDRSALTLLALLDLKPLESWNDIRRPLMGITPILNYIQQHYGRQYAPNTRETIRRQTVHQFVEAGVALYNPDDPNRAVNSPKARYQISEEAAVTIRSYGNAEWIGALATWLENRETLAAKWAQRREMRMIPVQVTDGREIYLTPGRHSDLIRQIIDAFAPRFAPGAEVIYVGDTGAKTDYFDVPRLSELGVTVDKHGKMPDVVLYDADHAWLLLVESVTSHGPVDAKRHHELSELFGSAGPGLVYVTAFLSRSDMARFLTDISWETEVWCADAPSHLIHFDGERFLGPHPTRQS